MILAILSFLFMAPRDIPEGNDNKLLDSEAYAKRAQRTMTIEEGQTIDSIVLKLDPKHSLLKIFVKDEKGDGFGAGFTFTNKSSQLSFRTGGSVDGKSERWLPPNIPFGLTVEARGHQAQKFDIELKPDEPLELEVIMVQSDPKFGALEVHVTDGNGQPETGTLILMIKENEQSTKFGIPLDPSGFRRYLILPDTPFWFEVKAGGRSIFHSRAVRGEEWIQLKSGEVMTVRYPFTRHVKSAVRKTGLRARGAVIMPCLERKNREAFARNLPEPVVNFSARIFVRSR